jgi:peptide deformylase
VRRRVTLYPSVELRRRAETVNVSDVASLARLIKLQCELTELLATQKSGVALAANQAGSRLRAFVISRRHADDSGDPRVQGLPTLLVNPEIVSRSDSESVEAEGCLSFPGLSRLKPRSTSVTLRFWSPVGGQREVELEGFWARVAQHEVEHLDGGTFIDDLPEKQRIMIAAQMAARKRRGRP